MMTHRLLLKLQRCGTTGSRWRLEISKRPSAGLQMPCVCVVGAPFRVFAADPFPVRRPVSERVAVPLCSCLLQRRPPLHLRRVLPVPASVASVYAGRAVSIMTGLRVVNSCMAADYVSQFAAYSSIGQVLTAPWLLVVCTIAAPVMVSLHILVGDG